MSLAETERTFTALIGNSQRLDGGSMFGNAPKALWSRWTPVDENNQIPLACNALLVEERTADGVRRILLETGIGAFFEPELAQRYGVVESEHVLLRELNALGLSDRDIDLVILSHLHFDHAGGLLSVWQEGREPELLFPNAIFLTGRDQWQRARAPHVRDKASYVTELVDLLQASGRLQLIDGDRCALLGDDYRFVRSDGHTVGMLLTVIRGEERSIIYGADLIPAIPWVNLAITMGYDRAPEQLIDEKRELLEYLESNEAWLFFSHDPQCFMAKVVSDDRGRYRADQPQSEVVALKL